MSRYWIISYIIISATIQIVTSLNILRNEKIISYRSKIGCLVGYGFFLILFMFAWYGLILWSMYVDFEAYKAETWGDKIGIFAFLGFWVYFPLCWTSRDLVAVIFDKKGATFYSESYGSDFKYIDR